MTTQQRIAITMKHIQTRLTEIPGEIATLRRKQRQLVLGAKALEALARLDTAARSPRSKGESIRRRASKRTRTMTPAQKKEVSVRMKRYWAKRRGELASKKK
jgi:hypothetical protein